MLISPINISPLSINRVGGSSFSIAHSFVFDGVDQYLTTPATEVTDVVTGLHPTFTISFWVKKSVDGAMFFFNKRDAGSGNFGFEIILDFTNKIRFRTIRTSDNASLELNSNVNLLVDHGWHYINIVIDGANSKIYCDTIDETLSNDLSDGETYGTGTKGTNYIINGYNVNSNTNFIGNTPQINILGIALTQEQITDSIYKDLSALYELDCVYNFNADNSNDTAQFTVTDSLNGFDIVSVNMDDASKTTETPY